MQRDSAIKSVHTEFASTCSMDRSHLVNAKTVSMRPRREGLEAWKLVSTVRENETVGSINCGRVYLEIEIQSSRLEQVDSRLLPAAAWDSHRIKAPLVAVEAAVPAAEVCAPV